MNKVLIVGGTFDRKGGKTSGLISENAINATSTIRVVKTAWKIPITVACLPVFLSCERRRYINNFKIPELYDLDLRIENEIQDVKVRKEHFAEDLGIKEDAQGEGV